MINDAQEKVLISEAENFSFQSDSHFTAQNQNKESQPEISFENSEMVEKRDFSAVFARIKKSVRKKSASIF